MVVAREPAILETIRRMRSHGMTTNSLQRLSERSATYDVTTLGYNYRMDELRAAIGLAQLRNLRSWNDKRKTLAGIYKTLIERHCPSVTVPFSQPRVSAHHLAPVVLPAGCSREHVIDEMREAGVQTTVHYPPAHRFSFYRSRFPSVRLPRTEEFASRELTLPLHPKLEAAQVEYVTSVLARAIAH